jgi:flagellar biosynthetic protein FlhB
MADNETSKEDRQLAPSGRKLQEARKEGNVPRSRDVGHALVLGAALIGFAGFGSVAGNRALELVSRGLRFDRHQALDTSTLSQWLYTAGGEALWIVVPCALLMAVAAIAASMIPGGLVLSSKPLGFNFARLNPASGISRIFSRDGLVDLGKLAVLAGALGAAAFWFASSHFDTSAALAAMPLSAALELTHTQITSGLAVLVALLAAVATADVPLQWYRNRRGLRMTHQEAREEMRQTEGDPLVRGRLRARQREIARSRMLAAVPSADVVITNPSHYAVAVRYDEAGMGAPRVVAKGVDHLAAKIREVAMDSGVPLFEAPPLARALYAHVEIDREIPAALYTAVAQVLAYVYQLRHFVPGRNPRPREPQDLQVPSGMDPQEKAE